MVYVIHDMVFLYVLVGNIIATEEENTNSQNCRICNVLQVLIHLRPRPWAAGPFLRFRTQE